MNSSSTPTSIGSLSSQAGDIRFPKSIPNTTKFMYVVIPDDSLENHEVRTGNLPSVANSDDYSSAISFGSAIEGCALIAGTSGIQGVVYASDNNIKLFDYTSDPPTLLNSVNINIDLLGIGSSQNSEKLVIGDRNTKQIQIYDTTTWDLDKTFYTVKPFLWSLHVIPKTGKVLALTGDDSNSTQGYWEIFSIDSPDVPEVYTHPENPPVYAYTPVNTFNGIFSTMDDKSIQFFVVDELLSIWNESNIVKDVKAFASENTQDKFLVAIQNSKIHIFEKTEAYCNRLSMSISGGLCI